MTDKILNSFDVWITAQGWKSKLRVKSIDNISLEGIARLRELILDLAIRGKLVPQDSSDEPASLILKQSEKEKIRLISEGKIKKHKELGEITSDKTPFELPNGWQWAWFADSYFFQEGPGIRNWQFRPDGIKLLNVQNIVNNKLVLDNTDKFIDIDEYNQKYLHFTIEENDLVFASSGGSWGKSAFFSDPGYKVIVNTSTVRIHPYVDGSSKSYLKCFLDSDSFKKQMVAQLVGMQPNFGSTHFLKVLLPVPPSNEQQKIGLKVDELMALCDELEQNETNHLKSHQLLVEVLLGTLTQAKDAAEFQTAWSTLAQHFDDLFITEDSIDQLKQTILQLAVIGKLVPQDPKDGPAREILKQIEEEKQRPTKDIKLGKASFEIPQNWVWCNLYQIADVGTGATPLTTNTEYYKNGDIAWVTSSATNDLFIEKSESFITEKALKETNCKVYPKGTLLVAMYGQGKTRGQVSELNIDAATNQACAAIELHLEDLSHRKYIKLFFQKIYLEIRELAEGGAQPNLNLGKIKDTFIPLPPLSEQKCIVAKVADVFATCDSLKEKIAESQIVKNDLSNAILSMV